MPTYPISDSPDDIAKKIAEGRGSGEKTSYKPWIQTHEITSNGISTSLWSYKLNRIVHTFSEGEKRLFWILEYSKKVVDYWEQYPHLPIEKTLQIANEHNIRHPIIGRPKEPSTKDPKVITTDFVVSVFVNGQIEYHPIAYKYSQPISGLQRTTGSNTLEDRRSIEKLEIERLSWASQGHKLRIITERDIPNQVCKNIEQAYSKYDIDLLEEDIKDITSYLEKRITKQPTKSLRVITRECDKQLGYADGSGTALSVVWHLIARRNWIVDLTRLIDPNKPLELITKD